MDSGPVAGKAPAAYSADVMLINSPRRPNIEANADTSRGKLSVHVDLCGEAGAVPRCDACFIGMVLAAMVRVTMGGRLVVGATAAQPVKAGNAN